MATAHQSWVANEISDDVEAMDAARIAHRLGGIVANDDRIREAIQAAIDHSSHGDASQTILDALAQTLTG